MPPTASIRPLRPLQPLQPDGHQRAWASLPHPSLPLLATAHARSVTVFSLASLSRHSALTGGHTRSVRSVAWEPGLPPHRLCLVTASFDSTAGLWRWERDDDAAAETDVAAARRHDADTDADWDFTLVLEGHDSEIKSCAFSPSGAYLATCSRDKSVWIWEDMGAADADDEWETLAILNEHEADVKAVAWCPDVPGRNARRCYSPDVLASASYDNTVRIWREESDGEWVCVAVLNGHDGTVWGLQWEPRPARDRFPRLLTCSADATMRVWTLDDDDDDDDDPDDAHPDATRRALPAAASNALGGIPNTMRTSLRETWTCTAILPKVHDRDIYAAAWSGESGLVASTGSDGILALYQECQQPAGTDAAAAVADASPPMANGGGPSPRWELLTTMPSAHGPYEVNHVTWCRRYDAACARQGEEEMLVTTGDDGLVRLWESNVVSPSSSVATPA